MIVPPEAGKFSAAVFRLPPDSGSAVGSHEAANIYVFITPLWVILKQRSLPVAGLKMACASARSAGTDGSNSLIKPPENGPMGG